MPKKKFIRRDSHRFSKIGKKRKKLQKWRRAKGRDNKMREKRFGYPKSPVIGFKKQKSTSGKLMNKIPITVYNIKDLEKINKENTIVIIGKVGAKKKLEILKKAEEMKVPVADITIQTSAGARGKNAT